MPENTLVPLYQQIKEDIKSAIERGKYKPQEQIPTEPELSAEYSVSRVTVRRAVEELHIPHDPSVSQWVTVSIGGVTVIPELGSDYGFYLKIADTMLYDAKKNGRNRVVWADERLTQMWERPSSH